LSTVRVERARERDQDPPLAGVRRTPPRPHAQHDHGDDRQGSDGHGYEQGDQRRSSRSIRFAITRNVDTRQLTDQRRDERPVQDLAAAALVGRADEHVGRAALADHPLDGGDEVVTLLLEKVRTENDCQSPQRGQLHLLLRRQLVTSLPYPECVERRTETLGGAPAAPQDPLRARLGCDHREHPLGERLGAERIEHDRLPACADALRDLAECELAEPGEPVCAKEVVQRDPGALG